MPDFKKHAEIVKESLEQNPETRNDDWTLFFDALFRQEGIYIPSNIVQAIKTSKINFKTLLRERQKIQSQGLYAPTNPIVSKKRRKYQEEYREHYGQ